jgi:tetratricopeptide (TPR) repeat protein
VQNAFFGGGKGEAGMTNETIAQDSELLETARNCAASLRDGIKTTQENVDKTILVIREYIQNEKERNAALSQNIKTCSAVFEKLETSVSRLLLNAELLNKQSASSAAFGTGENQAELLKNINANFADRFDEQSIEVQKQLRRILDNLSIIAHKCGSFMSFPKPYKEIVDIYAVKIEQMFGVLPKLEAVKNIQTKNITRELKAKNDSFTSENNRLKDEISRLEIKARNLEADKRISDSVSSGNTDPVTAFNSWASNPSFSLPNTFYYIEGDMKIRTARELRESHRETKWITNRYGAEKYLFPNPNSFDQMTNILDFYKMDLEKLKPKGQNKIKIIKACSMTNSGSVEFRGELEILTKKPVSNTNSTAPSLENWNSHYKNGVALAVVDPVRAVIELTEAIRLNPSHPTSYYYRGCAYANNLNYKSALSDFEKALELSPNSFICLDAINKIKQKIEAQ